MSAADICNDALILIGENPIVTASFDTSPTGEVERICARQYSRLLRAELRANTWGFTKSRASLAAHATAPLFGWTKAFPIPGDYLRLISLFDGAKWTPAEEVDYQMGIHPAKTQLAVGEHATKAILTDYDAPLKIEYVQHVTDTDLMDDLFQQALAARIARVIALRIAESDSAVRLAQAEYTDRIAEAELADAIESPPKQHSETSFISVRG